MAHVAVHVHVFVFSAHRVMCFFFCFTPQSTTNVVVVGQPTSSRTTIIRSSGDHFLTLSIVMTFICVFCGGLLPAVLTVAAIFVALSVSLNVQICSSDVTVAMYSIYSGNKLLNASVQHNSRLAQAFDLCM